MLCGSQAGNRRLWRLQLVLSKDTDVGGATSDLRGLKCHKIQMLGDVIQPLAVSPQQIW